MSDRLHALMVILQSADQTDLAVRAVVAIGALLLLLLYILARALSTTREDWRDTADDFFGLPCEHRPHEEAHR